MPEMETTDKVMDPNVLTIPRDGDKVRIQYKMSLTSAPTTPIAWSHPDERNAVHVDSNGELIKTDTIDQAVCKMMELRQSEDHYEFVVISLPPIVLSYQSAWCAGWGRNAQPEARILCVQVCHRTARASAHPVVL